MVLFQFYDFRVSHSSINIYSLRSPCSLDIPLVNLNVYAKSGWKK